MLPVCLLDEERGAGVYKVREIINTTRMREIKFRAWNTFTKSMEDTVYLTPTGGVNKEDGEDYAFPVMQYTGLKDKTGKEIYEGDVVKGFVEFPQLLTGDNDSNCKFQMTGAVFYDHSGFILRAIQHLCQNDRPGLVNYFSFVGSDGEVFVDREVIGNIHQNPELLK